LPNRNTAPPKFFEYTIPHNLTPMADAAGVYEALWRPDERGWTTAKDITPILE
jgi:hypothetical protein